MSGLEVQSEWLEEFASKIKSKTSNHERFTLLLCNLNNTDQKELLRKILFIDHLSLAFWSEYVEFTLSLHKDTSNMKSQLLRLINKALECLEPVERSIKDDSRFVSLHLHAARFQGDKLAVSYFLKINKKDIGKNCAALYMQWADAVENFSNQTAERKVGEEHKKIREKGISSVIAVVQKGVLHAQPNEDLIRRIAALQKELAELRDDGVVTFQNDKKSSSSVAATDKNVNSKTSSTASASVSAAKTVNDSSDSDDDAVTKTQQIEIPSAPAVLQQPVASTTTRATRTSAVTAASATSSVKLDALPIRASRSALSGKCVRLTTAADHSSAGNDKENDKPLKLAAPAAVETKPTRSITPRTPFSVEDTNIVVAAPAPAPTRVHISSQQPVTPAHSNNKRVISRKSKLSPEASDVPAGGGREALNDSCVVEFKTTNKRQRGSGGSSSGAEKKTSIAQSRSSATAATEIDSDCDDATVAIKSPTPHSAVPTSSSILSPIAVNSSNSRCDSSAEMDTSCDQGDTVVVQDAAMPVTPAAVDPISSHDNDATEEMDTVQLPPATVVEMSVSPVVTVAAAVAPVVASKVTVVAMPATPARGVLSSLSSSAANTPASGTKKKRRVSFAGGLDAAAEPPATAAAVVEVVVESNAVAVPAAVPVATTRASRSNHNSSSTSASSTAGPTRNLFDDPSNHITLNNRHYLQLGVLGKGGSGVVTRIVSKETGSIYAYKRISIADSDDYDEVCKQFEDQENEINLLKQLRGVPQIIELIDSEVDREGLCVSMVLEIGEIDLAKVLSGCQIKGPPKSKSAAATSSAMTSSQPQAHALDMHFARMIWREMLECVQCIHDKNIIHGDLKPANFVFVKGHLKLIDFGIAKATGNETTNVYKDAATGTLNYMSPESLMSTDKKPKSNSSTTDEASNLNERSRTMCLGRSSDIWSLGCILYQMMYGTTPFAKYSMHQKFHVIVDPKHVIDYSEVNSYGAIVDVDAIATIRRCLVFDRKQRATITGASGLLSLSYLTRTSHVGSSNGAPVHGGGNGGVSMNKENVKTVVDSVFSSITSLISSSNSSTTPRKKAKIDAFMSALSETDRAAIYQAALSAASVSTEPQTSKSATSNKDPVVSFRTSTATAATKDTTSSSHSSSDADTATATATNANHSSSSGSSSSGGHSSGFVTQKIAPFALQEIPPHNSSNSVKRNTALNAAIGSSVASAAATSNKDETGNFNHLVRSNTAPASVAHATPAKKSTAGQLSSVVKAKKLFEKLSTTPGNKTPFANQNQNINSSNGNISSAKKPQSSSTATASAMRQPLKALPLSIQNQITSDSLKANVLNSNKDRAAKWMKPARVSEAGGMKAAMEERLGEMRKYLYADEDDDTANVTETQNTGFNFF